MTKMDLVKKLEAVILAIYDEEEHVSALMLDKIITDLIVNHGELKENPKEE